MCVLRKRLTLSIILAFGGLAVGHVLYGLAKVAASEAKSSEPRPAEMSVWFRFDDPAHLDRSSSLASWPAECADGAVAPGRSGNALLLPGKAGNGLYLPRPTAFFGKEARVGTIAVWVCPAELQDNAVICDFFRRAGNSAIDGAQVVIFANGKKLIAGPAAERFMTIDNPLRQGKWTHVALTWDCDRGTRLWIDGQKRSEGGAGFGPAVLDEDTPGRIGGPTCCGSPFAGKLDDLRLWNRMLSDDELRAVYQWVAPEQSPITMDVGEHAVVVHNASDREAALSLATWAPMAHLPPPYWGYSTRTITSAPPDQRVCMVGPMLSKIQQRFTLPAKGQTTIEIGHPREYIGLHQIKLLTGEGADQLAVAVREFDGLTIRPIGCRPVVVRQAETVGVNMVVQNSRATPFGGKLTFTLTDAKGTVLAETTTAPQLPVGGERRENVVFACKATPGKYRLSARLADGGAIIEQFPVYVTSNVDPGRMHGTTTCWAHLPTAAEFDQAAADGVDAVLIGRLGDYGAYEKFADMALSRGLKMVVQASSAEWYYNRFCLDPKILPEKIQYTRNLGRLLDNNPALVMVTIAGEASSLPPCYCQACTDGFRAWLRKEYGSVNAMNAAWGTKFADWSDVPQLGNPKDIDQAAEHLKLMRVELAQPANYARQWQTLFELNKGRAMAWHKWQDWRLLAGYSCFVENFHAGNGRLTRAGEQPAWPNFNSQNLFGAARVNDIGGIDLYLPGEGPTTLGYPAELFCNFDTNRSAFAACGKPVAINELYIQDNSPAGEAEAQGWWLTGRGYGNLDYFTYGYYHESIRNNLPLNFGMFDKDGKPYPCHASFQRFCRDLHTFRALPGIDALRLERPRVALFMSDDMGRANCLETGDAPWDAAGAGGHVGAYWLTERSGFPLDFINDDGFDRLEGKRALVVPWTHAIRPESIRKIVEFARHGGTVILDGPVGLYDHNFRPYSVLPGGDVLSSALGLTFNGYEDRPNRILLDSTTGPAKRTAWYRFDQEQTPGECVGKTWQATIQKASLGDGKVGKGMVLAGQQNNGLYLANPVAFFGHQAQRGTIALWVKPDVNPAQETGGHAIVDFSQKAGNICIDGPEAVIYTDKDKIVATPSLVAFTMQKASPLKKGEWTHVALSWDSRLGAAFYINGQLAAERVGRFEPICLDADWPGRVGCQASTGGAPFAGTLDELRLFNYVLSSQEIRSLIDDTNPDASKIAVSGNWGLDLASQGAPVNPKVTKGAVLLKDTLGNPALMDTPVGAGKILTFLTNLGRSNRARHPDPNLLKLWKSLLEEKAGLAERYRFVPKTSPAVATAANAAAHESLFDVSVQIKENRELYLFLVSFFGSSEGTLELSLPEGQYSAADAITGQAVPLSCNGGRWQLPVNLSAVGGRVIRIRSDKQDAPFTGW